MEILDPMMIAYIAVMMFPLTMLCAFLDAILWMHFMHWDPMHMSRRIDEMKEINGTDHRTLPRFILFLIKVASGYTILRVLVAWASGTTCLDSIIAEKIEEKK